MIINCPFNFGCYQEEYNILICHPKGELTADMVNDIAICRECILKPNFTQIDRFHNLSDITSVNLRFNDVHQICNVESTFRKNAKPIKACYLVPNILLYGTIRMYQALIENCGVEVHVGYDTAVPVLPGSPVNSWFPDKLFANFLGYSKGHASVNS